MAINKNNQPIGVFDSGVGGLSVLGELKHLLPSEDFVFLADQLHVPYGEKSKEELYGLGCRIIDYLVNEHNIKMLVIACNTSTCNVITLLRQKYSFPIIGTVPAIKPAGEMTKTGTIAIISTPSTSKSEALQKLIENNCKDVQILNIDCQGLEDLVDEGGLDSTSVNDLLQLYLKKVKNSETDHLVLGCTHYPFLRKVIAKILGPSVILVDGGLAIAKRTRSLLETHNMSNKQKKEGNILYFTTGSPVKFSRVVTELLEADIDALKAEI